LNASKPGICTISAQNQRVFSSLQAYRSGTGEFLRGIFDMEQLPPTRGSEI
jgi:hypothetical protein